MKKKTTSSMSEVPALVENSVPEIMQKLENEIKQLDHLTDSKYRTSGNLDGFGDIKKETSSSNLIKAFSTVVAKANAYATAAAELEVESFPVFEVNGGTVNDWKQDIKLRIAIINHKEKLDKLNYFRDEMKKFLSKEDQKSQLMQEMASFLSK